MTLHPRRPLRSLLIGDCDHYFSPYIHGVAAACGCLGVYHSAVSIRSSYEVLRQRIVDVRPDVLWTHMLLWPPTGTPSVPILLGLCAEARRAFGTKVIVHDGDVKGPTRHPQDISGSVDLALLNHNFDRSPWRVPTLHWPYAAFPQDQIAAPDPAFSADIVFTGQVVASGRSIYGGRTALIEALRASGLSLKVFDGTPGTGGNTLLRTPEVSASALTVLGYGRPGTGGWIDVRVFQYPGAGALLLHDDVQDFLIPWEHYVPYRSGSAASVVEAVNRVKAMPAAERQAFREQAFRFGQEHHSYTARVRVVLQCLGLLP